MDHTPLLTRTYAAFNARDIDGALAALHEATRIAPLPDGRVAVDVHQVVPDLGGAPLMEIRKDV